MRYLKEPIFKKYVIKAMAFCHLQENLVKDMVKN